LEVSIQEKQMNISEMVALVRRDLHDEDSERYRFTDDALTRHILRAIKDFSEAVPLEQTATIETALGSRNIEISDITGRVTVEAVEYPAGKFPPCFQRFSLWADTLTLLGDTIPDGGNAGIYYGGLHTLGEETSPSRKYTKTSSPPAPPGTPRWNTPLTPSTR
jgi:hypothetical protein